MPLLHYQGSTTLLLLSKTEGQKNNFFLLLCSLGGYTIVGEQFRRICYPINDEEPTPALPKGGSLNGAQYSLTV